jgi:hypothetical protein
MGWSLNDVRLPKRFFETPSPAGVLDETRTRQAIAAYGDRLATLLSS